MKIPVTIYAHQDYNKELYLYVGASTNPTRRWPGVPFVVLEVTDLDHQVERETYWIRKLRREGHPLRNKVTPCAIQKWRPVPPTEKPKASKTEQAQYRLMRRRKECREVVRFGSWYSVRKVQAARKFLERFG